MYLCLPVDIAQQATRLDDRASVGGVHEHASHAAQVEHHGAFLDRQPGDVVATTANGYRQAPLAGEGEAGKDVRNPETTNDHRRVPVDHPIPHSPGRLVLRLLHVDHVPADPGAEIPQISVVEQDRRAGNRKLLQFTHDDLPRCAWVAASARGGTTPTTGC